MFSVSILDEFSPTVFCPDKFSVIRAQHRLFYSRPPPPREPCPSDACDEGRRKNDSTGQLVQVLVYRNSTRSLNSRNGGSAPKVLTARKLGPISEGSPLCHERHLGPSERRARTRRRYVVSARSLWRKHAESNYRTRGSSRASIVRTSGSNDEWRKRHARKSSFGRRRYRGPGTFRFLFRSNVRSGTGLSRVLRP